MQSKRQTPHDYEFDTLALTCKLSVGKGSAERQEGEKGGKLGVEESK